jgi:signal transduction histidine kinase/CheY-like chemotaxis protein/HAMP domain-containing protein
MPRTTEREQRPSAASSAGAVPTGNGDGSDGALHELLAGLTAAVAGDFSVRLPARKTSMMGQVAARYNELMEANARMSKELARVARVVGREGRMNQRMSLPSAEGNWATNVESVNYLIDDLVRPTTEVTRALVAVADGDLSQKMALEVEGQPVKGEFLRIRTVVNTMVDQLSSFAAEVTRVAREVGTEGKLGGQAKVKGVSGTWRDLTDSVNSMAGNLTDQVRSIAEVTTAVARGDLSKKITVEARGEVAALAGTINTMVDQLGAFADEVTRVAREVGTEGRLGGQADVKGVLGTWKDLTESVNYMAGNLTDQVRNIASVTTAVARGDLSQKITVDVKGEILQLKNTINSMVDQLRSFAAEVTRVAREVGTEGRLGGQAEVEGVSGTWKGLTDNVNSMAGNLTDQVRNIAHVATAVARGDLSQKITVEAKGEVAALATTINSMVDQLRSFAAEVTRVAKEVGTEGKLGGQAEVEGVSGTWRGLTDNVNSMAGNLTDQVRNIAEVTTAVAQGDLSKKITVGARGEILELKNTINTMVDQLGAFAAEVTRVAREVGTEGKLGGQAEVEGVSGTWRRLTENVNQLAANLTNQVRAIAEVSTAVTSGDLTRSISVEASGEVAELKDNINQMIANLKETTDKNAEQDWLKTSLARISRMMQGQRDLQAVSRLIMSELTPMVSAQHGAFFVTDTGDGDQPLLRMIASYGYTARKSVANCFGFGESLVGQAALEAESILVTEAPPDYVRISSGLGSAPPVNLIVLPVLFEDQVLGVIELGSFRPFSEVHQTFLDQVMETVGIVINTIGANSRTEELLAQSQRLANELQNQSEELQTQQEELQQTNEELQEKASLLEQQNRNIEVKNREIEMARVGLEEKAQQLALSSKYKSEFLANMSHELRTTLNSLLILAKLLADNADQNLTDKQVEFARTIHSSGHDLLALINDILDLSKIEAGRMDVHPAPVAISEIVAEIDQAFRLVAEQKGLAFEVGVDPGVPESIVTDRQRLLQVLKNLCSNACKFTDAGSVTLRVATSGSDPAMVAFEVSDTGIGIPKDKLQLIFEAFQQADGTTSRRYGGTGLGLSISREISRLLGGVIEVRSVEGQGSAFTFSLPIAYPGLAQSPSIRPAPSPPPGPSPGLPALATNGSQASGEDGERRPRRLLVVDDNPLERSSIVELVSAEGVEVSAAATSDEAIERLERSRFDGVILDLGLDGSTGFDLLERIRANPRFWSLPVIVHTAKDLTRREETRLKKHTGSIIVKTAGSRERLLEETAAVLSRAKDDLAGGRQSGTVPVARGDAVFEGKQVLIVDDDVRNVFALTSALEALGMEVIYAENGREGLEAVNEHSGIDVVLMDIMMPEMDGYEAIKAVRAMPGRRELPIIALTAKAMAEDRDRTIAAGASDYITKPVDVDQLVSLLRVWLYE